MYKVPEGSGKGRARKKDYGAGVSDNRGYTIQGCKSETPRKNRSII
jgi:hypothetical protein